MFPGGRKAFVWSMSVSVVVMILAGLSVDELLAGRGLGWEVWESLNDRLVVRRDTEP